MSSEIFFSNGKNMLRGQESERMKHCKKKRKRKQCIYKWETFARMKGVGRSEG